MTAPPRLLAGNGKDETHLLVVANGDKGLCGAFNSNIVKAAVAKAKALTGQGKTVKFYLVGRKGKAVINRTFPKMVIHEFDTTDTRTPGFDQAQAVASDLIARFDAGEFDVATLCFSTFKSVLSQAPTVQQIIPVAASAADASASTGASASVDYEPDEEAILADLLPRNLNVQMFKAMLENEACEQGASMTAMDNATRNAGDLISALTIKYNRSRQAAITTELVEIISGAEAL